MGLLDMMKFSDNVFFFYCLPPIVYASGFNMHRTNFFKNIKTILLFGIFGTFVSFSIFSAITVYLVKLDFMQ